MQQVQPGSPFVALQLALPLHWLGRKYADVPRTDMSTSLGCAARLRVVTMVQQGSAGSHVCMHDAGLVGSVQGRCFKCPR